MELNDLENGIRALKQALVLSPDDPYIIINTSLFMLLNDRIEEAFQLIQFFNTLPDQESRVYREVGTFFIHIIKFTLLRECYLKITKTLLIEIVEG